MGRKQKKTKHIPFTPENLKTLDAKHKAHVQGEQSQSLEGGKKSNKPPQSQRVSAEKADNVPSPDVENIENYMGKEKSSNVSPIEQEDFSEKCTGTSDVGSLDTTELKAEPINEISAPPAVIPSLPTTEHFPESDLNPSASEFKPVHSKGSQKFGQKHNRQTDWIKSQIPQETSTTDSRHKLHKTTYFTNSNKFQKNERSNYNQKQTTRDSRTDNIYRAEQNQKRDDSNAFKGGERNRSDARESDRLGKEQSWPSPPQIEDDTSKSSSDNYHITDEESNDTGAVETSGACAGADKTDDTSWDNVDWNVSIELDAKLQEKNALMANEQLDPEEPKYNRQSHDAQKRKDPKMAKEHPKMPWYKHDRHSHDNKGYQPRTACDQHDQHSYDNKRNEPTINEGKPDRSFHDDDRRDQKMQRDKHDRHSYDNKGNEPRTWDKHKHDPHSYDNRRNQPTTNEGKPDMSFYDDDRRDPKMPWDKHDRHSHDNKGNQPRTACDQHDQHSYDNKRNEPTINEGKPDRSFHDDDRRDQKMQRDKHDRHSYDNKGNEPRTWDKHKHDPHSYNNKRNQPTTNEGKPDMSFYDDDRRDPKMPWDKHDRNSYDNKRNQPTINQGKPDRSFYDDDRRDQKMQREKYDARRSYEDKIKDPRMEREKQNCSSNNENWRSEKSTRWSDVNDTAKDACDKEYDAWEKQYWRQKDSFEYEKVSEINGDLFQQPTDYSLAHCVAEDLRMGSGIAVNFKQQFKNVDDLLNQRAKQGGLATLYDEKTNRYVYYLVTKKESTGKPTYQTVWRSLCKMRSHMVENGVKKLAIPRLACGLDRLEWSRVKSMIEYVFRNVDVEIEVCNFQQEEEAGAGPKKMYPCKLFVELYPITDIEKNTLILYFSTEDGHEDETMRELSKKFNTLAQFQNCRNRKLGDFVYSENKDYGFVGCVVRKSNKDLLDFKGLAKCIYEINRMNKKLDEKAFEFVGYQWLDERQYSENSINQKVITLLINLLRNVDVYVCKGSFNDNNNK